MEDLFILPSLYHMSLNPKGATRLGLFLGLGKDENHWENGQIKAHLIREILIQHHNQQKEVNLDSLENIKLQKIVLRY